LETVVTPTKEQELPKQSMSHSDTNTEAGLSEKSDASLSVPVGFDKVMTTVNEPATVIPPVAQPRPDLHEVVKQVMDGMISPSQQLKSSQVIITLKPEHLGEVTVKINVDGDKVTAAFHAASTEVRGILESSLPQLRQEMSQQGWQFDSDGVFGGMQEFLGQQEQQQAQQQQMRSMINHARPDEYDDALAFSSNGKLQVMSATAVDYRI
jgi:flagellar hook-length control protein FliK